MVPTPMSWNILPYKLVEFYKFICFYFPDYFVRLCCWLAFKLVLHLVRVWYPCQIHLMLHLTVLQSTVCYLTRHWNFMANSLENILQFIFLHLVHVLLLMSYFSCPFILKLQITHNSLSKFWYMYTGCWMLLLLFSLIII